MLMLGYYFEMYMSYRGGGLLVKVAQT